MIASFRAELHRLSRWPAVWVTLGAWLVLALMFGYLFGYLAYRTGDTSFATEGATRERLLAELLPAALPDTLVQGMPMFGGALMLVLGAMAAGNGYGWGTWKTVFTLAPSRTRALAGTLAVLTTLVIVTVAVTLALYAAISLLIATTESQPVVRPAAGALARAVLGGALVLQMWVVAGFALGTAARGPALSVGLGLVWALVVENLLRGVGTLLGPVEDLTHVLPGTAAGSLIGAVVGPVPPGGDSTPGVVYAVAGAQATATVAAYVVGLTLLSLLLVRRRDLS